MAEASKEQAKEQVKKTESTESTPAATESTTETPGEKDLSEMENRDVKMPKATIVQEEVSHPDTPDVKMRPQEKKKVNIGMPA